MKLDELMAQMAALSAQLSRIRAEILAKVAALESAMGELTPEQQAVFDQLKQEISALDNIAPPIPEPAPEPEPQSEHPGKVHVGVKTSTPPKEEKETKSHEKK